jgi:peptidoglycan hydrolase-like protein with peptidoglycan-binding domain
MIHMAIKTYKKGTCTKLSADFNVSEFACHGSGCCSTVKIDDQLISYVQKIRDHFGVPVTPTSGYRCAKHNAKVGGASASRHTQGMAADIVVKGVAPAEVAKYAESIGIKGIGLYETAKDGYFVHVDTRPNQSFWYGQSNAFRSTFGGAPKEESTYTKTQFIKDVQKACGAPVDGVAGPITLSKTVTVSTKTNARHAVVRAIQKYLYSLGYKEIGDADGVAGVKFSSAVAHYQQDNDCVVDGKITAKNKTWKKLLGLA